MHRLLNSSVYSVHVKRKDGTVQFFKGMHIAGVWEGHLILSADPPGSGLNATPSHTEPLETLFRAGMTWTDEDADAPGEGPPDGYLSGL